MGHSRGKQKGSEVLEFGFVVTPMLGFTLLIIDIGWGVFTRSTLQYAVREGVRYAVTSQTATGLGQKDSIKQVVQQNALGMLAGQSGLDKIQVRFYTPETFTDVSDDPGANAGGNLVEVAVEGFSWLPLMPLMRSNSALSMAARAMDRMEASPPTGPPPL
ncbi:MAG TPA: TadE/TadG family type IV pilus assembly protein [Bryobacteraceae bacterium]|nr:TadE/TadG family type IV pilus assembly protein [Bryobacteraceae bacterium]